MRSIICVRFEGTGLESFLIIGGGGAGVWAVEVVPPGLILPFSRLELNNGGGGDGDGDANAEDNNNGRVNDEPLDTSL